MASSVTGAWNYPLQLNNLDAGVTNIVVNGLTNPLQADIQSNSYGLTSTNGMSLVVGAPSFPNNVLVTLSPGTEFTVQNDAPFFKSPLIVSYTDVDVRDASNVFAPTVLPADDSERIATTAYVKSVVAGGGGGNMLFSGASAIGNHCVSSGGSGLTYQQSALNETFSSFDFGAKALNNATAVTSTTQLNITAPSIVLSGTTVLSDAPITVGLPGSVNTKVSTTEVIVRDGSNPSLNANMAINQVQVVNGANNSKLTYDKLYSNSDNATTASIITIANDYLSKSINVDNITSSGSLTLTATGNVNVNATQAEFSATPIHTTSSTTANSFIKIGGTNAEVLLADGTVAPYNSGTGGNFFQYRFNTNTVVPPSLAGRVNFKNGTFASVTNVYVNHLTDDNIDIDFFLAQVGIGDILYYQDKTSSLQWVKYVVTSKTIIINSYTDFGVTYDSSEGAFFNNSQQIVFSYYVDTATINTRLNALEQKTVYQSTPTLNQTNFAGTVYADTLKIATGTSSQYLMADGTTSALTTIGTSGVGTSLVKTGTSPSFVLNSLAVSTGLSSNLAGDTITISNTLPSSDISIASSGSGTTLINSTTNPNFLLKSLAVGTGLSIGTTSNTITLTNTIAGSTLTSAGAGTSLVVSGTAPSLSVKSLSSGSGITLSEASNNLQIINSSPASAITLTNDGVGTYSLIGSTSSNPTLKNKTVSVGTGITIADTSNILTITNSLPSSDISLASTGTGTSLLNSTTNPSFTTKSLAVGSGLSITSTSNLITLTNSSPASGISLSNVGTTSLVADASTNPAFQTKGLVAGTNVTLSATATDVTINASGTWNTGLAFEFQPSNMSGGGQITFGSFAYYKSEWASCIFTATTINYWKLNNNSTTVYFGLFDDSGNRIAYTNASTSSTVGLTSVNFITPYTFAKGQKFWLGHTGVVSNAHFGIGLSITNVPGTGITPSITNTPYVYTASWATTAPTAIPAVTGTGSAILWYRLS